MSPFALRSFRSVVLTLVLALVLTSAVQAAPPPAPALTTDAVHSNLLYGAIPANGANAPVIVFVHGLGGNVQDWIEVSNCPTSISGCKGSNNDMYDYAYQAG